MVFAVLLMSFNDANAQRRNRRNAEPAPDPKAEVYNTIEWRSIGPYRGGRASTVSGVPGNPQVFYMGATGGGVWKTDNGGQTWKNVSDGYFGGSIGAVAVSPSNPDVVYVGQGEQTVRGNVSSGFEGFWKSTDGGETWKNMGLPESHHIGRILIDPNNSNVVYVAALGKLYSENPERGLYKTTNGGKSWTKVL